MLVIEMSDAKFGNAMKTITCIEHKLSELKEIFEKVSVPEDYEDTPEEEVHTEVIRHRRYM